MVDLVNINENDTLLYEHMFCDPQHMAELGGAQSKDDALKNLERQLRCVESGKGWVYKIVPHDVGRAVGTICVWESFWEEKEQEIAEMGWGVLPAYQSRGYATKAVESILVRVRETHRWNELHAYTTVTNVPSNKMCSKLGFMCIEQCDSNYNEKTLKMNHWMIVV